MLVVGFTKLCYNMVKNFEPAQDGLDIEDFWLILFVRNIIFCLLNYTFYWFVFVLVLLHLAFETWAR
jgi:hypothetical protein